ncbi:MAG: LysM peptidoglycan-binding domain-containing protein, partial [Gammaproteobacteria bacterium]|nr:LysM peptidoglycan-binding domain-containing protein [Gammaproteobacteria bacterium]
MKKIISLVVFLLGISGCSSSDREEPDKDDVIVYTVTNDMDVLVLVQLSDSPSYYDKGISLYERGDTMEALKNLQKAASLFFADKNFQEYNRTIAKMKEIGNSYTVASGDTLYGIARKIYGEGRKWSLL